MNQYILCGIAGLLGVTIHCLLKYNSLQNKAAAGNLKFSFSQYLGMDVVGIGLSFASIGVWLLVFNEVVSKYPQLEGWKLLSFVVMGTFGSYIIQYATSRAEKQITAWIDSKVNKADGVTRSTPLDNVKDEPPKQ